MANDVDLLENVYALFSDSSDTTLDAAFFKVHFPS